MVCNKNPQEVLFLQATQMFCAYFSGKSKARIETLVLCGLRRTTPEGLKKPPGYENREMNAITVIYHASVPRFYLHTSLLLFVNLYHLCPVLYFHASYFMLCWFKSKCCLIRARFKFGY